MTYWLDLFTGATWDEFLAAGGDVSGFRESRWRTVQKMKPGDVLLCYLTGVSRWVGALEVISEAYRDSSPIWTDEEFPCRVRVKPLVRLTPETAVPIHDMRHLSIFHDMSHPIAWTGHLRGSPAAWSSADGEAVMEALREAEAHPVARPVDKARLARRPRTLKTSLGPVTIPDDESAPAPPAEEARPAGSPTATSALEDEATAHTEIQSLLVHLGSEMGFSVWIARNDRSRIEDRLPVGRRTRLVQSLPLQFDEATNRTIELIDVLWLNGNHIVAAFEVESTTSIYSGLLRMSDLVAMQPNLKIQLYLVAPDERRNKVFKEVNRPTFSRLSPPMSRVCRYIAFSALRAVMSEKADMLRYLKPEYLENVSETCEADAVD